MKKRLNQNRLLKSSLTSLLSSRLAKETVVINAQLDDEHEKHLLKIQAKCKDKKFECAFHEIGHFVVMNYYRPESNKTLLLINHEGDWRGEVSEPDELKQAGFDSSPEFLLTLGKVAIGGATAESIYKTHYKSDAWDLLVSGKKIDTFKNDYKNFEVSHGYLKPKLDQYINNPDDMREYFDYLYDSVTSHFREFGLVSMLEIAQKLSSSNKLTGEAALKVL